MLNESAITWLTNKSVIYSDDSDTSSWSDVCSFESKSSEDEFEDYDDEDTLFFPLMQYLLRLRRKRVDDYLHIIDAWSNSEFKNRLRISRFTASKLIDDLDKSGFIASHKFGLKPLAPKLCLYIFLSFIANSEPLTPIATRFDISISSTFRVIRRVIAWLLTKLNEVVRWPNNFEEIRLTSAAFVAKVGMANAVGVIGCANIKIEKPKNPREYCNAKGYFSIVLQATVDANLRFTNIFCGEPGSLNCNRVLKKSPLYNTAIQDKEALFPHNTFLLAHSGYPSLPWLIPPFRESKRLNSQQRIFNTSHSSAGKLCKNAFKMLKARFKRIKYFTIYRDISFITDTVVAACILHNYCLSEIDQLEDHDDYLNNL